MKLIKAFIGFALLAAVAAAVAALMAWVWFKAEIDKPGPLAETMVFKVEPGDTLSRVAQRLEQDGVVSDARLLRLQARIEGSELDIKAGEFEIAANASQSEVLRRLIEGRAIQYRITLPEGRTTAQLLRLIEADTVLTGDLPADEVPEGSLLPDTYLFPRGMTRIELIARMQDAQQGVLDDLWPQRAEGLPLDSPQEAVILASIVDKEAGSAAEREKIAGLFITRMKRGMRLESDPTIIYGISKGEPLYNRRGERRTLYRSEIDRKTDWNTYQIDGLPITPIANPGRDAIAAVLQPLETGDIFFVADGKGGHLFAKTLAEHNRNVAAYRRYEREEIARERAN